MQERESDEPADQVISTDPAAGSSVPEGTMVTVFYSDGPGGGARRRRPPAAGGGADHPGRRLRAGRRRATRHSTEPKGTVIRQSPAGGQDAPQGSTVTIVVSAFEEPSESPSPTEPPPEPPTTAPGRDGSPDAESPAVQRSLPPGRDQRSGSA